MSEFYPTAVKRTWVPEWFWGTICFLSFGQLPLIYPFRWIFTTANPQKIATAIEKGSRDANSGSPSVETKENR